MRLKMAQTKEASRPGTAPAGTTTASKPKAAVKTAKAVQSTSQQTSPRPAPAAVPAKVPLGKSFKAKSPLAVKKRFQAELEALDISEGNGSEPTCVLPGEANEAETKAERAKPAALDVSNADELDQELASLEQAEIELVQVKEDIPAAVQVLSSKGEEELQRRLALEKEMKRQEESDRIMAEYEELTSSQSIIAQQLEKLRGELRFAKESREAAFRKMAAMQEENARLREAAADSASATASLSPRAPKMSLKSPRPGAAAAKKLKELEAEVEQLRLMKKEAEVAEEENRYLKMKVDTLQENKASSQAEEKKTLASACAELELERIEVASLRERLARVEEAKMVMLSDSNMILQEKDTARKSLNGAAAEVKQLKEELEQERRGRAKLQEMIKRRRLSQEHQEQQRQQQIMAMVGGKGKNGKGMALTPDQAARMAELALMAKEKDVVIAEVTLMTRGYREEVLKLKEANGKLIEALRQSRAHDRDGGDGLAGSVSSPQLPPMSASGRSPTSRGQSNRSSCRQQASTSPPPQRLGTSQSARRLSRSPSPPRPLTTSTRLRPGKSGPRVHTPAWDLPPTTIEEVLGRVRSKVKSSFISPGTGDEDRADAMHAASARYTRRPPMHLSQRISAATCSNVWPSSQGVGLVSQQAEHTVGGLWGS
ncbi:unnamed protein product [Chrysoparadoxa australica]